MKRVGTSSSVFVPRTSEEVSSFEAAPSKFQPPAHAISITVDTDAANAK